MRARQTSIPIPTRINGTQERRSQRDVDNRDKALAKKDTTRGSYSLYRPGLRACQSGSMIFSYLKIPPYTKYKIYNRPSNARTAPAAEAIVR
jgi:hypothetical protein